MTLWSPDTCSCQIEYSDDGNATFIATHNVCAKHAAFANNPNHLVNILTHNRQKNSVYQWLLDNADTYQIPKRLDPNGTSSLDLFLRYNPAAPVGNDPVIIPISELMPTITVQKKAQLQTAADQRFGVGTILVQ